MRRLLERLFGVCKHEWSKWGGPQRDIDEDSVPDGWNPESFQRRTCSKCGLIGQRRIGQTVITDPTLP